MILKLVKKSLGIECELMDTLTCKVPPSKQAFSKARYKICHTGFKELLELSIQTAYQDEPEYGTWRGDLLQQMALAFDYRALKKL